MIFAARQLQEKCQEQYSDLFTSFIDLTKAFDTVCRDGLWKIMAKYGCPDKFVYMVRQLHEGMFARVLHDGDLSEIFEVTNGAKQGCVLGPILFIMLFSAMLYCAFLNSQDGMRIRYRTDGKLFNLRRLSAKTKVKQDVVRDLLFADDSAVNTTSDVEMQRCLDSLSAACDDFGLTISTTKTEVMFQPAPGKDYCSPAFTIKGQLLPVVDKFTYLGSTLSRNVHIDDEVVNRISKASSAFGRLRKNVWNRKGLSLSTKLKVYKAIVLAIMLYACETWTVYQRHIRKLNRFHLTCLRKLLRIGWHDMILDTEVLRRTGLPSIDTMLTKAQLRWSGHIVHMGEERLPKRLLSRRQEICWRSTEALQRYTEGST